MGRRDQQDEHPRKKIKFSSPADTESDPFGEFLDSLASGNNGSSSSSSSSSVQGKNASKHRYHTRSTGLLSSLSTNSSSSSVLTQSLLPPSNPSSLVRKLDFDTTPPSKTETASTKPSPTNLEGGRVSYIKDFQSLIRVAMASGCFKKKCTGCGNHVQHCCGRTILEEISSIPHSPE